MGYDMFYVNKPEGEDEKVAKLREENSDIWRRTRAIPEPERGVGDAWDALMKEADAKENEIRDAEKSYFSLNIWGMRAFAAAMNALDMMYGSRDTTPWPEHSERIQQLVEAIENDLSIEATPEEIQEARAAIKQEQDHLSAHPTYPGYHDEAIPSHKFSSNDGWHVTPAEIHAALAAYYKYPTEGVDEVLEEANIDREIWDRWIAYLSGATQCGGFKVY